MASLGEMMASKQKEKSQWIRKSIQCRNMSCCFRCPIEIPRRKETWRNCWSFWSIHHYGSMGQWRSSEWRRPHTVATRMGSSGVPVKMAIPGFLLHALIPRNATFTRLDHSRLVTVISRTSPGVSISVREQKFGALSKLMKDSQKTFWIHLLLSTPNIPLKLKFNLKKHTKEFKVLSQFVSLNFGKYHNAQIKAIPRIVHQSRRMPSAVCQLSLTGYRSDLLFIVWFLPKLDKSLKGKVFILM